MAYPIIEGHHTSNDGGTGKYTSDLIELTRNTVYYVRAYASNSAGTGYGDQVIFETDALVPVIFTDSIRGIK